MTVSDTPHFRATPTAPSIRRWDPNKQSRQSDRDKSQEHEYRPRKRGDAVELFTVFLVTAAVTALRYIRIDEEGEEKNHQYRALPSDQDPAPAERDEEQAGADHHDDVSIQGWCLTDDGKHDGRGPEDEKHVGHVATDDVADREPGYATQRGLDADDQLRCRGAEGDNRQADDKRRYTELSRQRHGAADKKVPAQEQDDETADQLEINQQRRLRGRSQNRLVEFMSSLQRRPGRCRPAPYHAKSRYRRDCGRDPRPGPGSVSDR